MEKVANEHGGHDSHSQGGTIIFMYPKEWEKYMKKGRSLIDVMKEAREHGSL